MKKVRFLALLLTLVMVLVVTGFTTDTDSLEPVSLTFSTQGLGTAMNTQANTLVPVMLDCLPEGSAVDVLTNSPGGIAAPYTLEEGLADLTLGNSAPANWAVTTGIDDRDPCTNVASIAGGFDASIVIALFTQDFVDRTGFKTLEEVIEAKYPVRLATKATGSFGELTARVILEELGVTYDDIKEWGGDVTMTDSSNVVDMLKDNRADMTIDHTNTTQANYTELSMTTKLYMAPLGQELMEALNEQGYAYQTILAGTYNDTVTEDMLTVGSPVGLLCRADLDEEVVYRITKAICENKDELAEVYAGFNDFDPETACDPAKAGAPLHPGAEKYYKEMGWLE